MTRGAIITVCLKLIALLVMIIKIPSSCVLDVRVNRPPPLFRLCSLCLHFVGQPFPSSLYFTT